jgi:hypothetical protein
VGKTNVVVDIGGSGVRLGIATERGRRTGAHGVGHAVLGGNKRRNATPKNSRVISLEK